MGSFGPTQRKKKPAAALPDTELGGASGQWVKPVPGGGGSDGETTVAAMTVQGGTWHNL